MPTYDMSDEKAPKVTLPEGWRKLRVLNIVEGVSKAGNSKVIVTVNDELLGSEKDIHMGTDKGKRWVFKTLLQACGIKESVDGSYTFEYSELINKFVEGFVKHEHGIWTDRKGKEQPQINDNIEKFREAEIPF